MSRRYNIKVSCNQKNEILDIKNELVIRLLQWMTEQYANPLYLEIWPTRKCNLHCKFCGTPIFRSNKKELPGYKFIDAVKEIPSIKKVFIGGGGEPFCRKAETLSIMNEVKKRGIEGFIINNGSLLNQNDIRKIVKMKWDAVMFSLDAPDAKTHNYLRGQNGVFERVIRCMELLQKYKKEMNLDVPRIEVNMVVTNRSYTKIDKMIELGNKLGWYRIQLQSLILQVPEAKMLQLKKDEIKKFKNHIERSKKKIEKCGISSTIGYFTEEKYVKNSNRIYKLLLSQSQSKDFTGIPCYEPWYRMVITPEGNIGPCNTFAEQSNISAFSTSLKEAWKGEYFQKIREKLVSKDILDSCKKCCIGKVFDNLEIREKLRSFLAETKGNNLNQISKT